MHAFIIHLLFLSREKSSSLPHRQWIGKKKRQQGGDCVLQNYTVQFKTLLLLTDDPENKMERTIKKKKLETYIWYLEYFFLVSILGTVINQGYPLAQVIIPSSHLNNEVSLWSSGTVLVDWASGLQAAARREAIPAGCLVNCSRRSPKTKWVRRATTSCRAWVAWSHRWPGLRSTDKALQDGLHGVIAMEQANRDPLSPRGISRGLQEKS